VRTRGHVVSRRGGGHVIQGSWARGERGASSLEIAIIFPAILLLIMAIVQAGLFWHSRTLALSAAQEGLRSVTAMGGTAAAGEQDALSFLIRAGADGWLLDRTVTAERSATSGTVTVTGRTVSVIPGLPTLSVQQSASGPIERATR
jgi:Flp pilus assembly protein TadG